MPQIHKIAQELEAAEVGYELDDQVKGIHCHDDHYIRLLDHRRGVGSIVLVRGDKLVYFCWEALAGSHPKDYDFVSTDDFVKNFDRFILTLYKDTHICAQSLLPRLAI